MSKNENNKRPGTPTQATNNNVREFGRKARESRDEISNNRREIMRLDTAPVAGEEKRKTISLAPATKVFKKSVRPRKRSAPSNSSKRGSPQHKRRASASGVEHDNLTDHRTPLVSHLTVAPSNGNDDVLSGTVRIHGLPVATKRGDLIRFFAGLDPTNIFVLPKNTAHVVGWDAEDKDNAAGTGGVLLERHPSWFRVFVKFASAPVASLAVQRSGEVIYMGRTSSGAAGKKDETSPRQGATIAVSQIPKSTAKYLSKNMAVECSNNVPLQDTLASVEKNVHAMVPKILWSAAKRDLGLGVTPETRKRWKKELCYESLAIFSDDPATLATAQGMTTLTKIHNNLIKDCEALTKDDRLSSFPSVAVCDCPDMLRKPSTRLTNNAANILLATSKRIADYLHMARTVTSRRRRRSEPFSVFARLTEHHKSKSNAPVSPP